jgi:hypothetical protein
LFVKIREIVVKKGRARLLVICTLALLGQIQLVAQEKASSAEQEQRAIAEPQTREQRAASRAEAERKRVAAKAEAQEKRAAARVKQAGAREAAKQERATANAYAQEKQAAAKVKQVAARDAAEQKRVTAHARRAFDEAIRRAVPAEGTFKFLGSRPDFKVVVKGAPYSAIAITEYIQTLADGNQIMQKNEATYHRDREGRIRIDQTLKTIGKWTAVGDPPRVITIWDPVAGRYSSLDPDKQTALINPSGPVKQITVPMVPKTPTPSPGPSGHPKSTISSVPNEPKPAPVITDGSDRKKRESLGTRMIEGVSAEGTRTTRIIPAGEIGNVRPIEIVDESWYSSDLQMPLITRHHDPRSGDTVYRLTNINRRDPEPSLFEIPAGYRILDKTAPKLPGQPPGLPKIFKPAKKTEVIL